jgi:integrase
MSLPRYIIRRGDTYHVRKPVPLDLHDAFGGRKEITRSLRTKSLKEAVAASYGVLAEIEREFDRSRRAANVEEEDRQFLASDQVDTVFQQFAGITRGTVGAVSFARRPSSPEDAQAAELAIRTGQAIARPTTKAAALQGLNATLAEVEYDAAQVGVALPMDEDDHATLTGVPARHIEAAKAFLAERLEADRRSLEAQMTAIAGTSGDKRAVGLASAEAASLTALSTRWKAQRRPKPTTQNDMRTSIRRFETVNGPLGYRDITVDHARRFKDNLINDAKIKGATKARLWSLLRALLTIAVDDQLMPANPLAQIKVKFEDDAVTRETLTKADLATLFGKTDGEDWWMFRLGLYTGARLGEICQLTKADLVTIDGTLCLHIREDAEAGRSVKTKGSIRKVPVHQQLLADGFAEWAKGCPDRLFGGNPHATSKRVLRRMRAAGLLPPKVFHSLRHTFKGRAREVMDDSWHDRITGHAAKTIGQTYGGYDLRAMKEKIDLVTFGIEGAAHEPNLTAHAKKPAP